VVACDLGEIAAGEVTSVEIAVTVPLEGMTITNTAEVAALEFDLVTDDNTVCFGDGGQAVR
jgi:hypothetical protein